MKQSNNINKTIKPFLKWAGGKGQLISDISAYYPFVDKKISRYVEPFVGGGAILFDILSKYDLNDVYISDVNSELINTYYIIRDQLDELIEVLSKIQDNFLLLDAISRKELYLQKRTRFNELKINKKDNDNVEKAALMIFLNKTCFNGLYRVNQKGLFNVPMGKYTKPTICDNANLKAVSERLQKVNIFCHDYRESKKFIDEPISKVLAFSC